MTDSDRSEATVTVVSSLSEISRDEWDACANPAGATSAGAAEFNPFLSHDFLWSLEESGSAIGKTGWLGQHLVLDGPDGRPAAIVPAYLKSHSMGEYVFDGGWADAFEQQQHLRLRRILGDSRRTWREIAEIGRASCRERV